MLQKPCQTLGNSLLPLIGAGQRMVAFGQNNKFFRLISPEEDLLRVPPRHNRVLLPLDKLDMGNCAKNRGKTVGQSVNKKFLRELLQVRRWNIFT